MTGIGAGGQLARVLERTAAGRGLPASVVAQEISSRWQSYISMSQLVYPLLIALALKILFARRGHLFAEHLIFALHALAFVFLSSVVMCRCISSSGRRHAMQGARLRRFSSHPRRRRRRGRSHTSCWRCAGHMVMLVVRRGEVSRCLPRLLVTATALIAAALVLEISQARAVG